MKNFKVFVIGDMHLHNWGFRELNKFQEKLLTQEIPTAVKEVKPNLIVFVGDIFHVKKIADRRLLDILSDSLKTISGLTSKIYILTGNHDMYEGEPVLKHLEVAPNVKVLSEPWSENWNGTQLMFFPYHPPKIDDDGYTLVERYVIHNTFSEKDPLIVFSHIDIAGITYDSGHSPDETKVHVRFDKIREVLTKKKIYWINGHYHTPRAYGNHHNIFLVNTGNCFPFTATEERQTKVFTIVDVDWEKGVSIDFRNTHAPTLVVARSKKEYEELKKLNSDDFVILYRPTAKKRADSSKTDKSSSDLNVLELAMKSMKRRAKELGLKDTRYGEQLIKEALQYDYPSN